MPILDVEIWDLLRLDQDVRISSARVPFWNSFAPIITAVYQDLGVVFKLKSRLPQNVGGHHIVDGEIRQKISIVYH
jgi:hypothetical protein